ncbi:MAG: hypothetical protein J6U63_06090, partial [Clostridia bacterium]|nr:hypothetical protein [Clostridia bacterium]
RPAQPGRPVSPLRPGQSAPTVRSPKPASRGQVGKPVPGPLDKGPKGRRYGFLQQGSFHARIRSPHGHGRRPAAVMFVQSPA